MQSMACIDSYSLFSTKFLGVFARGDSDSHYIGKKRLKSGGSVSVLALPATPNFGSDTHDWPVVSNKSGLSVAADLLSTRASCVAAVAR